MEGDPKIHLVCHCNNCKQRTGSAFGISAYFADIQIKRKQGETAIYAIDNDSTQQGRHFYKSCGTTLYWKIFRFEDVPNLAEMTGIAGGCFTEHPLPPPTITAFNTGKSAWLEVPKLKLVEPRS